ncbi:MAG: hypothetical protein AAF705_11195, partial [Bacteroidota bacterium]
MRIQVFPLQWQGQKRIGIRPLGYDQAFPEMMKSIPGSRWTPDVRLWHIAYTPTAYKQLQQLFGIGQIEVHKSIPTSSASKAVKHNRWNQLPHYPELVKLEE